jgi:4-hydroxyphenylpyruvate dioxygenase
MLDNMLIEVMMCMILPSLEGSNVSLADGSALQLLTRHAYNEIGSIFPAVYNWIKKVSDAPLKPLVGSSNKGGLIRDGLEGVRDMSEHDFLPIQNFDFVEFYVGDAKQSAFYFSNAWGFTPIAYAGLEMGSRDRASYVLEQGNIRLVVTSPLVPSGEIAEHVKLHGVGVKTIALRVDDAAKAYQETTSRGARGVMEPKTLSDEKGVVKLSAIATYGETIHVFVERKLYGGVFMPGYREIATLVPQRARPVDLAAIDHIVGNVELGKMNEWVSFYERVMGFSQLIHFDDRAISTEYSALMSKVMQNGSGRIKFPINEPAPGRRKSQIEEFLDFYYGPGVQHVALLTDEIISAVRALKDRGVEFLSAPQTYYDHVLDRVGKIKEDINEIAELGILVDRDDEGYLLQIFSKPIGSRPTVFFEVIQRKGARGFGEGNFKALFEALEREQELRGNL